MIFLLLRWYRENKLHVLSSIWSVTITVRIPLKFQSQDEGCDVEWNEPEPKCFHYTSDLFDTSTSFVSVHRSSFANPISGTNHDMNGWNGTNWRLSLAVLGCLTTFTPFSLQFGSNFEWLLYGYINTECKVYTSLGNYRYTILLLPSSQTGAQSKEGALVFLILYLRALSYRQWERDSPNSVLCLPVWSARCGSIDDGSSFSVSFEILLIHHSFHLSIHSFSLRSRTTFRAKLFSSFSLSPPHDQCRGQ